MTSLKSSRYFLVVAALLVWSSVAVAGRKRVVVLDFEGPKAEKFHDDLVKLLKKSHTVISTEKWNGAAEELDAAKVTEKNVKKVAKKLKVDGVISGKIEKRRDEYIIRLKLRAGTSGELVGNSIDTKAEGPRLDGKAQGDLKDELIGQIDDLDSNKGGGGDDEDDADSKPSKKKKHADDGDEDADAKPSKKKHSDDDDSGDDDSSSKHSAFSKQHDMKGGDKVGDDDDKPSKKKKHDDDADDADAKPKKTEKSDKKNKDDDDDTKAALRTKHDDDESPLPKSEKKKHSDDDDSGDSDDKPKKKVAKKDDDDDSGGSVSSDSDDDTGMDSADALSPAHRAIDVSAGLSFTGRNLGFEYKSTLSAPPPGYKQAIPVAGGTFDATFYPMAFNRKNKSITSGIGIEVLYDKALKINSQKRYIDMNGAGQVANLETSESRLKIAAVLRYPVGKMVVGGKLGYQTKRFNINQTLPNNDPTDVPNVYYKMIEPEAFLIYPASPKLNFNASAGFLAVTDTGDLQKPTEYGAASVTGFDLAAGIDYGFTKNIFLRAEGMLQTIGMSFKGDQMSLTNTRDNDPTTQEVVGARDTYFGGAVTLGYIY